MGKMKKNYKIYLIIAAFILLVSGCKNDNIKDEVNNDVLTNSYSVVFNNLNNLVSEVKMFPTRDNEEKFIYYIEAIKENHNKFSRDELVNFSNLLNFDYQFSFNKLDYDTSDFSNDKQIINSYIK